MNKHSVTALIEARNLGEKCLKALNNVPDYCKKKSIMCFGGFECEKSGNTLNFWREGLRYVKNTRLTLANLLTGACASLYIFENGHTSHLENIAGMNIEEQFGEHPVFPRTLFRWERCEVGKTVVGRLDLARVDLNNFDFVSYYASNSFRRKTNRQNHILNSKIAPEIVYDGDSFFGKQIDVNIDFDKKAIDILRASELWEFTKECLAFSC